ncbi:WD40 repeat-like protein [Obba rivulosa]|uniref:WD40 repeat-like protein n=1 Tax=Obba rivulosa TaxID=1052685 RepID=A0A8E2AR49_9APHY|nr:WD40 repeat-like protein [Obba rivulosa]
MSDEFHAHKIYAQRLYGLGHGMPLWVPEPTANSEVEIGDVGYLYKGRFYRLFNATLPASDPIFEENGCPGGTAYQPFQAQSTAMFDLPDAIPPKSTLYCKSLRQLQIDGQAATPVVGGGLSFQYTGGRGAILVLEDGAVNKELHEGRRLANYMRQNYESWNEWAQEKLPEGIEHDDIIFVRGWMKTTQWAVAAFADGGRAASLSFNTNLPLPANPSLTMSVSSNVSFSKQHRIGPSRLVQRVTQNRPLLTAPDSQPHIPVEFEPKANQCVFLQYYKIKSRRWWIWRSMEIKAAAEPRDLSRPPDEGSFPPVPAGYTSDTSSVLELESVPGVSRPHDPIDDILDYIFKNSEAEVAIGNDGDVYTLCRQIGVAVPENLTSLLESAMPFIEVNEDRLGMLSFEGFELHAAERANITQIAGTSADPEMAEETPTLSMDQPIAVSENDLTPAFEQHVEPPLPSDPSFVGSSESATFGAGTSYTDIPDEEGPIAGPSRHSDEAPGDIHTSRVKAHEQLLLQEHEGSVVCCDISPDGRYLATGSEDAVVRVWDASTGNRIRSCPRGTQSIVSVMFHPTRPELLVASADGSVIILHIEDGSIRSVLGEHEGDVCAAAFSPDGRIIASVSVDFVIGLWHADTGERLANLVGHTAVVLCLAFSADSKRLISGSGDHIACVWDVMTANALAILQEHEEVVTCAAFSPDGLRVITGSDDGTARIWKVKGEEELVTLGEHTAPIHFVTFFPDGQRVLSASDDGTIKMFSSWDGSRIHSWEDNDQTVTSVAVSDDGSLICAGVGNNSVKVWNADTGELVTEFVGHTDKVNMVKFAGDRVLSASDDRSARVWKIEG